MESLFILAFSVGNQGQHGWIRTFTAPVSKVLPGPPVPLPLGPSVADLDVGATALPVAPVAAEPLRGDVARGRTLLVLHQSGRNLDRSVP